MTYREILSMLIASHVAIGVALAIGLVAALWCWRLYRGLGPMTLRRELLHIGGGVATVAIGAVLDGASWQSVLSVSAIALLGAMGWNSSTSLPAVAAAPVDGEKPRALAYTITIDNKAAMSALDELTRKAHEAIAAAAGGV